MKKIYYIIFLLLLLFCFSTKCDAHIYRATITTESVNLRVGPGTNYSVLEYLEKDSVYTMISNTLYHNESGCENDWYKIYFNGGTSGYVCSDYVNVETIIINEVPVTECEKELNTLGFPSSYWGGLCALKEKHPNWHFTPILTNLDWSDAVNNESSCGTSYISSSILTNIDTTCKNPYKDTWYPASSTAVAYYMDPRNFFVDNQIFQFEYLKYDPNLSDKYAGAVSGVIKHTEFYKYHLGLGNELGAVINLAGNDASVSPIHLSARMLQELGSTTKLFNLYSGNYAENNGIYLGHYNFFNINVDDVCATSEGPSVCGLKHAVANGWNSLYNAIYGGAKFISSGYISVGQYSAYLQKFNVVPDDKNTLYIHQYMTNIQAPSSEAKTAYNTYKELGLLDSAFSFFIPVYNNMDDSFYNESSGAVDTPNTGETTNLDINTIITSSGFKYSSEYLTGVKDETNISNLINAIESIAGLGTVKIKNKDNTLVTDGLIGTGYKVEITTQNDSQTLVVIINGDTSGDGLINALDLLQVQKNILGTYTLSDVYKLAGDASDDGEINALDLLQIQKHILGTYKIEQ